MKVVFLEDVTGTARIGEIKDVKPGFARNYLLPRKLAAPATPAVVKSAEQRAIKESRLQEARDMEANKVAERLQAKTFTFNARAGATGKLFGSVGTADIAGQISEAIGSDFERQHVHLGEPIKELGDYQVNIRLTRNVNATLSVSVIGEDGTTAADIRAKAEAADKAAAAEVADVDAEDDEEDGDDED